MVNVSDKICGVVNTPYTDDPTKRIVGFIVETNDMHVPAWLWDVYKQQQPGIQECLLSYTKEEQTTSTVLDVLERERDKIAAARDKLRELESEIREQADSCDAALDSLSVAVDELSTLV